MLGQSSNYAFVEYEKDDWRLIIQTVIMAGIGRLVERHNFIRDGTRDQDERNDYMVIIEEWKKRSSLNGKVKGLGSYGKYGRASSYPVLLKKFSNVFALNSA